MPLAALAKPVDPVRAARLYGDLKVIRSWIQVATHTIVERRQGRRRKARLMLAKDDGQSKLQKIHTGVKEAAHELIDELPDDATWDHVLYRLAVRRSMTQLSSQEPLLESSGKHYNQPNPKRSRRLHLQLKVVVVVVEISGDLHIRIDCPLPKEASAAKTG